MQDIKKYKIFYFTLNMYYYQTLWTTRATPPCRKNCTFVVSLDALSCSLSHVVVCVSGD